MTTDADIDFSSLPQVDQTARPPVQRRPRFDGDVSELTQRFVALPSATLVEAWQPFRLILDNPE